MSFEFQQPKVVIMKSNVLMILLLLASQVLIYYVLSIGNVMEFIMPSKASEERPYFEVLNVQLSKFSKSDYGLIFAKLFLMAETKTLDPSVLETNLSDEMKMKNPLKIHLLGKDFHFFTGI